VTPRRAWRTRASARLLRAYRLGLYAVGGGLWLSGGLWLLFHYLLQDEGPFGPTTHPLEAWWLAVHGGFAVAATWTLGLLWGVHVVPGWSTRRRQRSGVTLLVVLGWLVLSGYLLYYLGDEQRRAVVSVLHWTVGLGCPAVFAVHRLRRRSLRRSRQQVHVA
jgi:hypothetical protein